MRVLVFMNTVITVAFPICGCKDKHCGTRLCAQSFPSLPKGFALCSLVSVTGLVDSVLASPDLVRVHKSWGEGCYPSRVSIDVLSFDPELL